MRFGTTSRRPAVAVALAVSRRALHRQRRRHHDGAQPADGAVLAQRRLQGAVDSHYASPVGGDGKVFMVSESGILTIVNADAQLSEESVNDLDDIAFATPAIADGRLYARTATRLTVLDWHPVKENGPGCQPHAARSPRPEQPATTAIIAAGQFNPPGHVACQTARTSMTHRNEP